LWAAYLKAQEKVAGAEAELSKAKRSRAEDRIRSAQRVEQTAQANWRKVDRAVEEHRRSHFMTAGSGSSEHS
jgi:hypothetical protein